MAAIRNVISMSYASSSLACKTRSLSAEGCGCRRGDSGDGVGDGRGGVELATRGVGILALINFSSVLPIFVGVASS